MDRKYHYQENGQWFGEYSYAELKGRNIANSSQIWFDGLCPNNRPPQSCGHIFPFSELVKQYETISIPPPKPTFNKLFYLGLLTVIFVFALFFLYIFFRNEKDKEEETVTVETEIPTIKMKLRATLKTKYYETQKMPNPELVKGLKGDYYIINLKNAQTNEKILFKAGEYIIDDFNEQFLKSLNNFMSEIYTKIDSGIICQIFVKGSADIVGQNTFKRNLDIKYGQNKGFAQIEYYKSISNSDYLFIPESCTEKINNKYTNSNLPNLRGKFFQYKISQSYGDIKIPIILEGRVRNETDSTLRNANLILLN